MHKIRTLIIDDETRAREAIRETLNMYAPELEIIGEADSVLSGLKLIKTTHPELVFLDIKMPDGTGFDILKRVNQSDFHVVFLTAFDEFAIKAFKFSALDYLLKPIDVDELLPAIEKVKNHLSYQNDQMALLLQSLNESSNNLKKVILKTSESVFLVKLDDIIRCESSGGYTKFYLSNQKPVMVSRSIKEYDEMFIDSGFLRVHQSHLVNLQHVLRFDKTDGGSLHLSNKDNVPVSTRRRDALLTALENI